VYELILVAMENTLDGMGHAATMSLIYSVIVLIFIGFGLLVFRTKKDVV
jgi:hypothetical protein